MPAGAPDTQTPGALTFGMIAGFNIERCAGQHALRFVAIGGSGNAGTQFELQPVCIDSRIPDNGHACTPSIAPPAAVFTLAWDTNFDLDMHVVVPGGDVFDTKMRVGEPLEAGAQEHPRRPALHRSRLDAQLRARRPAPGRSHLPRRAPRRARYFIFVDPFAACGQNAVHFTFTVYQSSGKCPACNLQANAKYSGELLASQVTGGTSPPTFVAEIPVQ